MSQGRRATGIESEISAGTVTLAVVESTWPRRQMMTNGKRSYLARIVRLLFCSVTVFWAVNANGAQPILFGGLGGHSNGDSTNDGALGTVDPTTGVVTIVGHPAGVARITGLAFDSLGLLFATTQ